MEYAYQSKFYVGQIVHHNHFDYRGVVVDVDPVYQGSDTWYEHVAKSRPPKDRPWYKVLVDGGEFEAYVAERYLEPDPQLTPISHPDLRRFFQGYADGAYTLVRH